MNDRGISAGVNGNKVKRLHALARRSLLPCHLNPRERETVVVEGSIGQHWISDILCYLVDTHSKWATTID
jgi:hypothetical protein